MSSNPKSLSRSSSSSKANDQRHHNQPQVPSKSHSVDNTAAVTKKTTNKSTTIRNSCESAGSKSSDDNPSRKRFSVDDLFLSNSVSACNLREFLQSSTGRSYFRRFLESEFAQENLNFYERVEELTDKARTPNEEVDMKARNIYSSHIGSGATEEVNLPYEIKQHIDQVFEKSTHNGKKLRRVFDLAQDCVLEMLGAESFRRFATHPLYAEYLKEEKEEGRRLSDPNRRSIDSVRDSMSAFPLRNNVDRAFSSRSFYL